MSGRTGHGFTLAEIAVTLVLAVVIIGLAFSLLLAGQTRSRTAVCASNLRQVSLALSLYMADNDDTFPPVIAAGFVDNQTQSDRTWRDLVVSYVGGPAFPHCPQMAPQDDPARSIDVCGYALNERLNSRQHHLRQNSYSGGTNGALPYPSLTITVFDARAGILALRGPDTATHENELRGIWRTDMTQAILGQGAGAERHGGGANYSFADGHARWLKLTQVHSQTHSKTSQDQGPFF